MKLPVLPSRISLRGKCVLLRVDWNIPLQKDLSPEDSLKLTRSYATIHDLVERGAIVIVLTHLGRPEGRDPHFSTKRLLSLVERGLKLPLQFLPMMLDVSSELMNAKKEIDQALPGSIFLCENVRFFKGEETNTLTLTKAFASLGTMFINDAFASCHRSHASVVGLTRLLPSFAGSSLVQEVEGLEHLVHKPKHPFVAVVGGAKLSTKTEVLTSLSSIADKILIGGAMAHPFFVAQKKEIGKSLYEKEAVAIVKKLLKNPKIVLPTDVVVGDLLTTRVSPRVVRVGEVKKRDVIGDIGTETMREWSEILKTAKTIVWNGPVGVTEIPAFAHGSRVITQAIATRSHGPCYGVVGGGDTLPIVMQSGMADWIDHLSTGGGAMLEFLAKKGKLPGLVALEKSSLANRIRSSASSHKRL